MSNQIESRLKQMGIELPVAAAPVANYVPFVISGNLVFVSGQLPMASGKLVCTGQVGNEASLDDAKGAARQCAINLIAQAKAACGGDLDKISRVIKLGGFVNSGGGFTDHAQVINGASDLFVEVFADKGKHARAAVGSSSLPFGASVEIEAVFELES